MRKSLIALGLSSLLLSGTALAKEFVLTDVKGNVEVPTWSVKSEELGLKGAPAFTVSKKTLHGGKQEGSTLITISTADLQVSIIPTRGMALHEITSGSVRAGWDSPVDEIVNPAFINLDQRGGLGWLDGFNEAMVRAGYEWTGHPGQDEKGRLLSLHGRAGNTPASTVIVSIDDKAPHTIHVKGLIKENTFKFSALETWSDISVTPGEKTVRLHDVTTNTSDYDRPYQIIYHSNFGTPLLEEGAKFLAPAKDVSPFNEYAKKGLKDWQTYLGPTKGYDETVYNIVPLADAQGGTVGLLHNKAGDKGLALSFNVKQLPVLTLWKNTDTLKQGYVTGIEPGTNYAYAQQIERQQGRLKMLPPGGSQAFDLDYTLLTTAPEVAAVVKRIDTIQGSTKVNLITEPMAVE